MSKKGGQKTGPESGASNGKLVAKTANAWNRPLKAKTPGPPPGLGPDKSRAQKPKSNGAEVSNVVRERLLHLSLTLVGQKVTVTHTNGAVLEGVFHTFTPFPNLAPDMKNKYVLKMVKTVKQPTSGDKFFEDGGTVIVPVEDVISLYAKNVSLDRPLANGGPGFASSTPNNDVITDTQISGSKLDKDRKLVSAGSAWTAGAENGPMEGLSGLEDKGGMTRKGFGTARPTGLGKSIGEWDQFKANEELFNVQASYDENLYTTALDLSQIDAKKRAEAERIAKEIENTASTNIHIAEERGQAIETDFDEEDRYSGVLTKDGKQRHEAATEAKTLPKKMNYAAAAAKADAGKKSTPPGLTKSDKPVTTAAPVAPEASKKETKATEEPKEVAPAPKEAEPAKKEEKASEADAPQKEESKEQNSEDSKQEANEETKEKVKSKLNANAKAFTFNPSAKSFTPSFGGGNTFSAPVPQPQQVDPQAQMHAHPGMRPPHYMHPGPMGQPGMMPMMNPQFQGMGYPSQYQGVDPNMGQMQAPPQQQHSEQGGAPVPPPIASSDSSAAAGNAQSSVSGDDENASQQQQEDDSSQHTAPQQLQQGQQMGMPYNVPPPGAYFGAGGMPMHPRGPGYPPQFTGGPQQMGVGPGGRYPMYPMQPGGMPPNMHMHGPGGAPYYPGPGGPVPYPPAAYGGGHGMMEDGDPNFRGRGGRGPGGRGGRGRGGRGRGGRGRGQYNNNFSGGNGNNNSGRNTPQQSQSPENAGQSGGDGK